MKSSFYSITFRSSCTTKNHVAAAVPIVSACESKTSRQQQLSKAFQNPLLQTIEAVSRVRRGHLLSSPPQRALQRVRVYGRERAALVATESGYSCEPLHFPRRLISNSSPRTRYIPRQ